MPEAAVFFPMAAPSGPVGYARVWVDTTGTAGGLPLDNFDVQTAGEAWTTLHAGALFPVAPSEACLAWEPSFLGSPGEVDAGRSKGRSAHLATLLSVAAWRSGHQSPPEQAAIEIWASGELDPEGQLKPVDHLEHKLRIFFERLAVHNGSGMFIAPAANRTAVDLQAVAGDTPVLEHHFTAGTSLPAPRQGHPVVVWVNRADVRALLNRLLPDARLKRRRRTASLALMVCLGVLATFWGLWWRPVEAAHPTGPPVELPAGLKDARFAIYLPGQYNFDLDELLSKIPRARSVQDGLVWSDDGSAFRPTTREKCGGKSSVPSGLSFRFRLDRQGIWASAHGSPSEALAALSMINVFVQERYFPKDFLQERQYNAHHAFDPRMTLLYAALSKACLSLQDSGAVQGAPATIRELASRDLYLLNALEGPVASVYLANACCSEVNECKTHDRRSSACPLPDLLVEGSAERWFTMRLTAPRHAYLSLSGSADSRERVWAHFDDKSILDCTGASMARRFMLDTYPERVRIGGHKSWSQYGIEFMGLFVADGLEVTDVGQTPDVGLSTRLYPQIQTLRPGWIGVPRILFEADFNSGSPEPFEVISDQVEVEGGRLRLVRTAGHYSTASAELTDPVDGDWTLAVDFELITGQSSLSVCLRDSAWQQHTCLAMNTKTENGSRKGVHLFCNKMNDNSHYAPEATALSHRFDPQTGHPHHLQLEHDHDGTWRLRVDGLPRGETRAACLIKRFDRITLHGFQDSNAGHGGYVDDLILYRQEFHPIEQPAL